MVNEENKTIVVKELPIGVSEHGELVCIPQTADPPKIGVCGGTGTGKSMCMGAIADRMYWYWKYGLVLANDFNGESTAYLQAMKGTPQFDDRFLTFNEQPTALPVMLCIPDSPEFHFEEDVPHMKICLPYKEFLKQPSKFMDLAGSTKYVQELAGHLETLESADEAMDLIKTHYGKTMKTMIPKLNATFKFIYDEKIFDCASDGVSAIEYEGIKYNPIAGCLLHGLVPSLYTVTLKDKDYFANYFQNIMSDIYNLQVKQGSIFKERKMRICFIIDELSTISEKSKETVADKIINQCMRQGRFARISVIWVTQNVSKINAKIAANTNYLLAFAVNEKKDIDQLKTNYNLEKRFADDIPSLEKFECIAMTRDYFVIYDEKGNRTTDREPRKIICLPPLSYHKKPEGFEDEDNVE